MSFQAVLLALSALGLLGALASAREGAALVAVVAYTGVLLWLLRTDIALFLTGLVIAIGVGVVAVGRRLHAEAMSEPDTIGHNRHNASKVVTNSPSF